MALVLGTNCGFCAVAPTADPNGTFLSTTRGGEGILDTAPAGATTITEIGWWCNTAWGWNGFQAYSVWSNSGSDTIGTKLYSGRPGNVTPSGGMWLRMTGLSLAITAGTKYWICAGHEYERNGDYGALGGAKMAYEANAAGGVDVMDYFNYYSAGYAIGVYAVTDGGGGVSIPVFDMNNRRRR